MGSQGPFYVHPSWTAPECARNCPCTAAVSGLSGSVVLGRAWVSVGSVEIRLVSEGGGVAPDSLLAHPVRVRVAGDHPNNLTVFLDEADDFAHRTSTGRRDQAEESVFHGF